MTATLIEMLLLRQMEELVLIPLPPELESNAKDSLREEDRASPSTMETLRLGSMTATQVEMLLLRQMEELVSTLQPLLESELNVKDLLKEEEEALHSIMVIPKLGLTIASQEEMLVLRQMVELVLMLQPLLVLVLNAKDLLKEEERVLLNFNIMVIPRHGSMIAIQAEMFRLKPMVELESMPQLLQELVSSAKDLLKRNLIALPSIVVTPKLGSMIATQEEMLQLKPMEVQESMPQLLQESVLSAKDLLNWKREEILKREPRVLHNTTETLRHGLMLVIQLEMCLLRPTQVVLEHGKLDKMDHSQE